MATDPRNIRPAQLVRLLNSTPLGEVIDERQLHRHRGRAGLRVGDSKNVDLIRYVAWLFDERVRIVAESARQSFNDPMPGNDREWFPLDTVLAFLGISKPYFDRDVRPRLADADWRRNKVNGRKRLEFRGPAVVEARNARQTASTSDDPLLAAGDSPGLERYRLAKAKLAEIELERQKLTTIDRDKVHDCFGVVAGLLRQAGEVLQRQYGRDALQIVDDALQDAERTIVERFGGQA